MNEAQGGEHRQAARAFAEGVIRLVELIVQPGAHGTSCGRVRKHPTAT
jgi:hypothetical protein